MKPEDHVSFSYTIKRNAHSHRIRIAVEREKVRVSVPREVSPAYIEKIIREHTPWIIKKITESRNTNVYALPEHTDKKAFRRHRIEAQALVHDRIRKLNAHYNFSFNRIAIRNQKGRWGSCSKQKNLNFNYRIALLPLYLTDYVIVHELCHLQELNHSPKFWDLVSRTIPEHRACRKELNAIKFN